LDLRIQATIEVIRNGISGKLETADLASQINLSASRLRHIFRAETGLSLTQYIKVKRMQKAAHLLRTSFLTVKEVMYRVGFSSRSHFSREFRRMHNLAPSKYRAKARPFVSQPRDVRQPQVSKSQLRHASSPNGSQERACGWTAAEGGPTRRSSFKKRREHISPNRKSLTDC
jgi:AraC-like DNA-binding protein